jgi:hypothetical protein
MWVTESRIRGWASDAIANGEVSDSLNPATADIEDVIALLHEEGNFTFTTLGDYS